MGSAEGSGWWYPSVEEVACGVVRQTTAPTGGAMAFCAGVRASSIARRIQG